MSKCPFSYFFNKNQQDQQIQPNNISHEYIHPSDNDIRGACPALNILANHSYINHSR